MQLRMPAWQKSYESVSKVDPAKIDLCVTIGRLPRGRFLYIHSGSLQVHSTRKSGHRAKSRAEAEFWVDITSQLHDMASAPEEPDIVSDRDSRG